MAAGLGYSKFTFAPYTNQSFWASLKSNLGSLVDRAYLQGYAGGAGNNPATWNRALGMTVDPGRHHRRLHAALRRHEGVRGTRHRGGLRERDPHRRQLVGSSSLRSSASKST
ncbi:hypothetical protein OG205_04415 [Lentzea sp. NBC_00516]|uniref:hypothetical protein n=1 Tax=Lentzea sp. NBC_00516 TaxID=2903582 RepID=UPI002E810A9A|nr:hypothetical protein [Lentzea sp. NBC_00516]WUD26258.1 hypothetical protein OG205_04415 [Lentzea sp. NBC_00516]